MSGELKVIAVKHESYECGEREKEKEGEGNEKKTEENRQLVAELSSSYQVKK